MSSLWRANRLSFVCACLLAFGLALGGCTEESGQSGPISPTDTDIDDAASGADAGVDTGDAAVDTTADATTDTSDPEDSGDPGDVDPQDAGDIGDPGDAGDSGDPGDAGDTGGEDAGDAGDPDASDPDTGPPPACTDVSDCSPRTNTNVECVNDSCEYTCVGGYDSCDGDPSSGCETHLDTSLDHCGACGDSCYPANATGVCQQGSCEMDDCDADFVDLNDDPSDGCECEITDAVDVPDQSGVDSNCDGIDGMIDASVFVSEQTGDDSNDGLTSQTPVATIGRGIEIAGQQDPAFDVLVAEGTYDEYVVLEAGVDVYGGYSSSDWSRDPSQHTVVIQPTGDSADSGHNRTVVADGLDAPTVVDSVDVYGVDAQEAGSSTTGVWVRDSGDHLTIAHTNIVAGAAADGLDSDDGDPVSSGSNGQNAADTDGAATNDTGCGAGGSGGSARPACDQNVTTGEDGADGIGDDGEGGLGGDNYCRGALNDACQNTAGADGVAGADGADGDNGQAGSDGYGFFTTADLWHADPGVDPIAGDDGSGGGGGGAGGSCSGPWLSSTNGGGGGAGGSGGCGGEAATNGQAGGGSFGLIALGSTVALDAVDIAMGPAGDGGNGGVGSTGRPGGQGGLGSAGNGNGEAGGNGGPGGHGGDGGNGAGGCGGPAVGIATADGGQLSGTNYTVDPSNGVAGAPGSGGINPLGAADDGCTGEVADEHAF